MFGRWSLVILFVKLVFDLKELPGESSYKSQAKEVINQ